MKRLLHIVLFLAFTLNGFSIGCSDAIYVEPGSMCTYKQYTLGSSAGQVSSSDCGWVNKGYKEVWIRTKMPSSGRLSIRTEGHYIDGFMALYKGSCESLKLLKCSNNGRLPENLDDNDTPAGTTLYIRIALSDKYSSVGVCLLALKKIKNTDCNMSAIAADLCSGATLIQSPKGYCGNTSSYYTPEKIDGMPFCGTIENNSWLKFVAAAETAELNVVVSNCNWGNGIQMNIYETDDCLNFTPKSNCWNPAIETSGVIEASGLTPGKTYYLMVDGYAGDVCNYVISAGKGVAMPQSFSEVTICEGERYTKNGFDVSEPGVYRQEYVDSDGNDASKVLYLKVAKPVTRYLSDYFYPCQSYTKYGFNVNTEGTHYRYLKTKAGCDSIVELHLTAYEQKTLQLYDTIYSCQRYTKYGFDVNTSGKHTQTLKSVAGCDSLVELYLKVLPTDTTYIPANIYACERYTKNGFDTNEAGVHFLQLQNKAGCDSVVMLDLMVLPYKEKKITATICNGEPYKLNGFSESESGTYTKTFMTALGCDSIVTLVLKVDDLHLKIDGNKDICRGDSVVLYASGGTSFYIWQDADGNEIGRGDSIVIKPTETKSYFLYSSSEIPEIKSVTDICGNEYPVVKIGEQYWTGENMRCEKYDTESEAYKDNVYVIPYSYYDSEHSLYYADATDKSKWYSAEYAGKLTDEQIAKFGYFYSWSSGVGVVSSLPWNYSEKNRQGICPNGWHIPNRVEWGELIQYCNSIKKDNAGNMLKTITGWYCPKDYCKGTDDFGFSALPTGYYASSSNKIIYPGALTYYLLPGTSSSGSQGAMAVDGGSAYLEYSLPYSSWAQSVRCVKNPELIINPEKMEYDYKGGTFEITVKASTTWKASVSQDWITLSSSSGSGNAVINVKVAENMQATATVDTIKFTTPKGQVETVVVKRGGRPELVNDICGNEYPVVTIGTQIWLGKNMKCNIYDTESEAYNASWITNNTIPAATSDTYTPYYIDVTDVSKWPNTYHEYMTKELVNDMGYLYNWAAAIGIEDGSIVGKVESESSQEDGSTGLRQGICPNGWHVPTSDDWSILFNYIGTNYQKENVLKLKSKNGWSSSNGSDAFGFAMLPAGYYYLNKLCYTGTEADFWSSTSEGYMYNHHYIYTVEYRNTYSYPYYNNSSYSSSGHSVRCLKNTYIEEYVTIEPTQAVNGEAKSTYTVSSNTTWTATADQEWIKLSAISGSGDYNKAITVTIDKSASGTGDVGTITVTTPKGKTASVSITKTVTDACGNTYSAIIVGSQTWMGENLRCDKYSTDSEAYKSGITTIQTSATNVYTPFYVDASDKNNWKSDKYAGDLGAEQITKLGYLYNWAAAVGVEDGQLQTTDFSGHRQGICPSGWHIPTDLEWKILDNYVDTYGGEYLKSKVGWYYSSSSKADKYGFEALPAGKYYNNTINKVGEETYFWSATTYDTNQKSSVDYHLSSSSYFLDGNSIKNSSCSVRCLKD